MILWVIVLTWSDVIAIYAAVVSSVAIYIELIRLRKEFRNRIHVKIKLQIEFQVSHAGIHGERNIIQITTTNDSFNSKFIERPLFETDIKTRNGKVFSFVPDFKINYPLSLVPGEVHTFKVDCRSVLDQLQGTKVEKIWRIVSDTLGKQYSSKSIKVKDIQA